MPPKISVIMSVHNGTHYLQSAINSVLNQTFSDFEFIVINDGSTDNSLEILQNASLKDKRIKVISRHRRGLTSSLNEGLTFAQGEYIARMDADDISILNRFKTQCDYLEKHPDCVALGAEVLMVDPEGWPIGPRNHPRCHEDIEVELLQGNGGGMTHPVVTMRKTALMAVGGYNEKFITAQDLDLFLKLAEVGQLHNLTSVLLKWRQHSRSVNYTRSATWKEMKTNILKDTYARRKLISEIPDIKDFSYPDDIRFMWSSQAYKAGYYGTAIKNMLFSLINNGFSQKHLIALSYLIRNMLKNKSKKRPYP